jgi:hypothetical protein
MSKKASFGSISSGTMRPGDLIPVFADELRTLRGTLPRDIYKDLRQWHRDAGSDLADELLASLFSALEEFAPAYGYFGAHEGDGSDYGFWLGSDAMQDFDGLRVEDLSEVPKDYCGEVLHVNDHGNMTLYVGRRGHLIEVWAVV